MQGTGQISRTQRSQVILEQTIKALEEGLLGIRV